VLDTEPRPDGISERQQRALAALAAQTMAQLELKLSTAIAREESERLAAMFAQASVGMSEIRLDGRFVKVNERLCEMLGRPREEVLTLGIRDATHPDDLAENMPLFERLAETGESLQPGQALPASRTGRSSGRTARSRACSTRTGSRAPRSP
jgi:PAS domain S-box-containing protein